MPWHRVSRSAESRRIRGADVEILSFPTDDRPLEVTQSGKNRHSILCVLPVLMQVNTRSFRIITVLLALLVLPSIGFQPAESASRPRRIYLLEALSPAVLANVRTIEGFKRRLHERTSENFEIFVD